MGQCAGVLKLTVFGPGFGEAIVGEVAERYLFQVDCCAPAAAYVKTLHDVRQPELGFIVLTHPHYDHYQGMPDVLGLPFGKLCRFGGVHAEDVRRLVGAEEYRGHNRNWRDAQRQFMDLMRRWNSVDAASRRRVQLDTVIEERLFKFEDGVVKLRVSALGPSEASIDEFHVGLARLNSGKREPWHTAEECNAISVILSVEWGATRILLAADAPGRAIERVNGETYHVLKIPHHGSRGSCPPAAIDRLMDGSENSVAVIAPFWARGLPKEEDVDKLRKVAFDGQSRRLFVTAARESRASASSDWALIGGKGTRYFGLQFDEGLVTLYADPFGGVTVEKLGDGGECESEQER